MPMKYGCLTIFVIICVNQDSYFRRCDFFTNDGRSCTYVAPSLRAFRRHLIVHHGTVLEISSDYAGTETFRRLPALVAARRRYRLTHRQGQGRVQRHFQGSQRNVRSLTGHQYPYSAPTGFSRGLSRDVRVVRLMSPPLRRPTGFDAELSSSSVVASRGDNTEIEISGQDGARLLHLPQCLPLTVNVGVQANFERRSRTVATQIGVSQSSIGTDARPLPEIYISVPSVGIPELALRFANYLRAFPESPLDVLADEIIQTFGIMQRSQSGTVRWLLILAVNFYVAVRNC